MSRHVRWIGGAAIVFVVGAGSASAQTTCDRACLRTMLDQYLAAVVKHDPAAAPLVVGFRQTENAINVRPGNGVWKTVTGLGKVQRRYLDPVTGQAAYYGTVEEGSSTAVVTVRVRVENRQLTEAEWYHRARRTIPASMDRGSRDGRRPTCTTRSTWRRIRRPSGSCPRNQRSGPRDARAHRRTATSMRSRRTTARRADASRMRSRRERLAGAGRTIPAAERTADAAVGAGGAGPQGGPPGRRPTTTACRACRTSTVRWSSRDGLRSSTKRRRPRSPLRSSSVVPDRRRRATSSASGSSSTRRRFERSTRRCSIRRRSSRCRTGRRTTATGRCRRGSSRRQRRRVSHRRWRAGCIVTPPG